METQTNLPLLDQIKPCLIDNSLPPVPHMWVPASESNLEKDHYMADKFLRLTHAQNKLDTIAIFYHISVFNGMLSHFNTLAGIDNIRIYMSICTKKLVGNSKNRNNLTLIFSPHSEKKTLGYYWMADDSNKYTKIDDGIAVEAIRGFVELTTKMNVVKIGLPNIDYNTYTPNNGENIYHDDFPALSDTRSVVYHKEHFVDELIREIDYQNKISKDQISGIHAYFTQIDGSHKSFKERLSIQFDFTKTIDEIPRDYFIEEDPNFCKRLGLAEKLEFLKDVKSNKSNQNRLDNGQMCPPTCATKPSF